MLIGQYVNAIDDKGRLLIPSKFRSEIAGDYVYVAPGIDSCLRLYTATAWEVVVKEITESGSTFQEEHRRLIRAMIAPASDKEVLVVGSIEYIELWDPKEYQQWMNGAEQQIVRSTEELGGYLEKKKREGRSL